MEQKAKRTESAGGVVLNQRGEVLVVNQNNDSWSLPKGHIDPGETGFDAAIREIQEESGITDLSYVRDLGTYERWKIAKGGGDDHSEMKKITLYLFTTHEEELKPTDPHNPEARWVKKEEVAALLTHPKDKAFFDQIKDDCVLP